MTLSNKVSKNSAKYVHDNDLLKSFKIWKAKVESKMQEKDFKKLFHAF